MSDIDAAENTGEEKHFLDDTVDLKECVRIAAVRNAATKSKRHSPLFEFTRILRGHPALRHLDAFEAAEAVEPCISASVPDKPDCWAAAFADCDSADPRAEFIATWTKIRVPGGEGALETALMAAKLHPLRPARAYSSGYSYFISVAGHLQHQRAASTICLPVVTLAALLGCDQTTISNYRRWSVQDGILAEIAAHDVSRGKATEYIFCMALFDWDSGKQVFTWRHSNQIKQKDQREQTKKNHKEEQRKQGFETLAGSNRFSDCEFKPAAQISSQEAEVVREGLYIWYMKMASYPLTSEQRSELERWEEKNLGEGCGTSNWPGWESLVGEKPLRNVGPEHTAVYRCPKVLPDTAGCQ